MEEGEGAVKTLTLKIITPRGTLTELECDSVRLTVMDGEARKGGGSYGIRPGHLRSVYLLDSGDVVAFSGGSELERHTLNGGFATVDSDTVTVISE